jgi:hypothetical protein
VALALGVPPEVVAAPPNSFLRAPMCSVMALAVGTYESLSVSTTFHQSVTGPDKEDIPQSRPLTIFRLPCCGYGIAVDFDLLD